MAEQTTTLTKGDAVKVVAQPKHCPQLAGFPGIVSHAYIRYPPGDEFALVFFLGIGNMVGVAAEDLEPFVESGPDD